MNSPASTQPSTRWAVGLFLAVTLALTACSASPDRDGERGPTPLGDQYYMADDTNTVLDVEVQSCNGDPRLDDFEVTETEVRIQVVATTYRESEDCQDVIRVFLGGELDDRPVIDLTTGNRLVPGDS